MNCPFGGECIDWGIPSDCTANKPCAHFSTTEGKAEFDTLPDKFIVEFDETSLRFKNRNQVKFFLTDRTSLIGKVNIFVIYDGDHKIKVDIAEFFDERNSAIFL